MRFEKPGSRSMIVVVEDLDREQRDEADQRADAQRHVLAVDVCSWS